MKYLIASDIHGCAPWCERLLEAFDREKADRLVLLGDLLYHGPRNGVPDGYDPMRVAELLNARKNVIRAVRGNCDADIDQMVLQFPMMADYALLEAGSRLVFATHGHLFNLDQLPPLCEGDILLHGHTHVPACVEKSGVRYLNPGSVGRPKAGSYPSYMTVEDRHIQWKELSGRVYRGHWLPEKTADKR